MRARLDRNPFAAADKLYDGNRVDMAWSAEQIRALLAVAPRHAGRLWGALDLPGG